MPENARNIFDNLTEDEGRNTDLMKRSSGDSVGIEDHEDFYDASKNIEQLAPHIDAADSLANMNVINIIYNDNISFISSNLNTYKDEFVSRADRIVEAHLADENPCPFEVTQELMQARQDVHKILCPRSEASEYLEMPMDVEELDSQIREYFVLSLMKIVDLKPMPRVFVPPTPDDIKGRWKRDKKQYEDVIDFIRTEYSSYLHQGLHRGHIKAVDPQLYIALKNWLAKPNNFIPDDLGLGDAKRMYEGESVSAEELSIYRKVQALRP